MIRHLVECSVVVRPALDSNDIGDSPRLVIQLQQVLLLRRSVSPLLGDDDGAVSNNVERLQTSFLSVPQSVDQPPVFGSVICRARVSIRHTCNPLDVRGMTVRSHPHNHCTRTSRARISPRPSIEEEEEEFVGVFGLCRAWDQRAEFTVEQSVDIRSKHPRVCCVPGGFTEILH